MSRELQIFAIIVAGIGIINTKLFYELWRISAESDTSLTRGEVLAMLGMIFTDALILGSIILAIRLAFIL